MAQIFGVDGFGKEAVDAAGGVSGVGCGVGEAGDCDDGDILVKGAVATVAEVRGEVCAAEACHKEVGKDAIERL